MRLVLATMLIASGLAVTCVSSGTAHADQDTCPPVCDRIPDTAWISPAGIPLNFDVPLAVAGRASGADHWHDDASVPVRGGVCDSRVPARHPQLLRSPAERPSATPQASGSCRPKSCTGAETPHTAARTRRRCSTTAAAALRGCQLGAAAESPSVTTRRAQSTGRGDQRTGDHPHLSCRTPGKQHDQRTDAVVRGASAAALADNSDAQVLDAMTSPVCAAYIGSC